MFELKEYQQKAVLELRKEIIRRLAKEEKRQKVVFKAPTGAGKTVVAFSVLSEVAEEVQEKFDLPSQQVAYIWLAPNKLHEQSYLKMKNFFSITKRLRPMRWDDIDHSLESLQHGDILFLNWESVNKDNAIIMRDSEQRRNLREIAYRTQVEAKIPIVVIVDEEHMFAGRNARKSEKVLQVLNPLIEFRISATPETPGDYRYTIDRSEVIKEEMIKKNVVLNPNIKDEGGDRSVNQQLLKQALKKRNSLKERYEKLGKKINPLLLIQLPNDNNTTNSEEERKIVEDVKAYLSSPQINITTNNGKLAVWLSNEKTNLTDIEKEDSIVEVLLFKQAIALGWDCPRAAVLLIFRDLQSVTFTVQTVGRILRMPEQCFYMDDALNHGYVYTNLSANMIVIAKDDMDFMSKYVAYRKKDINNVDLTAEYINKKPVRNRLQADFKRVLCDTFRDEWHLNEVEIFEENYSAEDMSVTYSVQSDKLSEDNQTTRNKLNSKLDFNVSNIFASLPKDLEIESGVVGLVEVNSRTRMARSSNEIDRAFYLFCRKNVGDFAKKDSTPVLVGALMEMMNKYFNFLDANAKKTLLYHENRYKVVPIIEKALQRYRNKMEKKKEASEIKPTTFLWQIPEQRLYNEETHEQDKAYLHAMEPYYKLKRESLPENRFSKFLEQNADSIEWWYKNGDSGKENFSIAYESVGKVPSLFYVDYIIHLRNGITCLFDTKTKQSDMNAPSKHNALIKYINEQNKQQDNKLLGGIIIEDAKSEGVWKYSNFPIENTEDLQGWDVFSPKELNEKQ
ncbi:MAG: DEAD/DEAH box helicase family protein [Bacteroidota bacterium]|nr:DEAD/DEAH box helicase family protein [Bacteroidota bacterium]